MPSHLPKRVNKHAIFTSFDVVNLCTNILHDYEITEIQYWLDTQHSELPASIEKGFIVDSLIFILENNIFAIKYSDYRQTAETVMGTKVIPTYANLVMGLYEPKIYNQFG